ncbi:unnamed protein product [Linum trigynum]|uniref:Uncharacterized protein n=1 Tax=Linum trigynum TaxID=586398 RepID=A0AAV2G541_9ROSI
MVRIIPCIIDVKFLGRYTISVAAVQRGRGGLNWRGLMARRKLLTGLLRTLGHGARLDRRSRRGREGARIPLGQVQAARRGGRVNWAGLGGGSRANKSGPRLLLLNSASWASVRQGGPRSRRERAWVTRGASASRLKKFIVQIIHGAMKDIPGNPVQVCRGL